MASGGTESRLTLREAGNEGEDAVLANPLRMSAIASPLRRLRLRSAGVLGSRDVVSTGGGGGFSGG